MVRTGSMKAIRWSGPGGSLWPGRGAAPACRGRRGGQLGGPVDRTPGQRAAAGGEGRQQAKDCRQGQQRGRYRPTVGRAEGVHSQPYSTRRVFLALYCITEYGID